MKNELKSVATKYNLYEKLERLEIDSPADLISKRPQDLQKLLPVNSQITQALLKAASKEVYDYKARQVSKKGLLESNVLTTGDATIDKLLNKGIPLRSITEVVGESSSGKTQFVLQLCLSVQLPKLEGGQEGSAIYIHSEGPFPTERLAQLAKHNHPNDIEGVMNNIRTMRVKDVDDQYNMLAYHLPAFVESQVNTNKPVRLVVIDSICAVYRGDSTMKRFEKMKEICDLSTRLKQLAIKYNLAIVAINQVSDVFTKDNIQNVEHIDKWMDFHLINQKGNQMLGLYIESLLKKPILGLAWSNSVNTRIRLARSPMLEGMRTRRIMFIEFSPVAPRLGCEIQIEQGGIRSC